MKIKSFISMLLSTALVGCATTPQNSIESKLYGAWNCATSDSVAGITMSTDYQVVYHRNGKANTTGHLIINLGDIKTVEYFLATTSNWTIDGNFLIDTTEDVKLKAMTKVPKGSLLDVESLIPDNVTESSRIIEINNQILKLVPESTKKQMTCIKD